MPNKNPRTSPNPGRASDVVCRCRRRRRRGGPGNGARSSAAKQRTEEHHILESWKDKQPKVSDLSDVVEVVQDRAAMRAERQRTSTGHRSAYTSHGCVSTVCTDQLFMAMVVDAVADLVSAQRHVNTLEGRFLAEGVARLVEAVHLDAFRLVPADEFPRPDSSSVQE